MSNRTEQVMKIIDSIITDQPCYCERPRDIFYEKKDLATKVDTEIKKAELRGRIEGIREYAWWKDGTQNVGTCGRTFKEATAELEAELKGLGE